MADMRRPTDTETIVFFGISRENWLVLNDGARESYKDEIMERFPRKWAAYLHGKESI